MKQLHTAGKTEYTADCPYCGKSNHLYISASGSKTILYCQGCKRNGSDIAPLVGLRVKDLFDSDISSRKVSANRRQHIYRDENGNPVARKTIVKYESDPAHKDCYWELYKNGEFIKGLGGYKPPLYNVACLKTSTGIVFFVEGEKDVETLKTMGYTAVSAPNGGGQNKWLPQYNNFLNGRDIVIIADNDEVGNQYASFVAQNLQPLAGSVKVIPSSSIYPKVGPKGDITDIVGIVGTEAAKQLLENSINTTAPCVNQSEPAPEKCEAAAPMNNALKPIFFDGNLFLHHVMGDYLIEKYNVCKINGALHAYHAGIYTPDTSYLEGLMITLCPSLTDTRRKEVLKYLRASPKTPYRELSPPNLIPFKHKVYNLETRSFLDYNPDMVFLNRFPTDYIPDCAFSESVFSFIRTILNNDSLDMSLLLEGIGNCYYRANSYGALFMLYGENANNGKSSLLQLMRQLLGEENTSSLSLQELNNRFHKIMIYGKAANLGDDIPSTHIEDSSTIKAIVTGGRITGERKGIDPIEFYPTCKHFYGMNELPTASDKTPGWLRRLIILPLNADFSDPAKCDPKLRDKHWSEAELNYLTFLAVDGLHRLIDQGGFTESENAKLAKEQYILQNDSVAAWIAYSEETGKTILNEPIQPLYHHYEFWCSTNHIKSPVSPTSFTRSVNKAFSCKSEPRPINGLSVRCFIPY